MSERAAFPDLAADTRLTITASDFVGMLHLFAFELDRDPDDPAVQHLIRTYLAEMKVE